MLSKLFGSQARLKLLKLFVLNQEKRFYLRQIARDLKLQVNSVRREIERLESFGLIISSEASAEVGEGEEKSSGTQKYFRVDTGFVLYEEIRALIIKAQILYEREFIEKLQKIGAPKLLVYSGFFVNNNISPVDLLIVGRFHKPRLNRLIRDLEADLGKEIDYTIMDSREFKYRRSITDVFLYDILEGRKIIAIDEFGLGY